MLTIDPKGASDGDSAFGSVPSELAAAGKIVESRGADMIDVNMGCPVHKIVSNGEGSALMKDPDKVYAILAALVDAVSIPVTVKFRAGWDEAHKNAAVIAQMAEKGRRQRCLCPRQDAGPVLPRKGRLGHHPRRQGKCRDSRPWQR